MSINSLSDLLERPFKSFTKEEQIAIAKRGRFTDLVNLLQVEKGKNRRSFATSWYDKVKWLTGDVVTKKLYCWNCVLYPSGAAKLWNSTGFDDLRNLSQGVKKHEESRDHIYATVKLKLLLCEKNRSHDSPQEEFEKNIKVKRNREYLERLIDVSTILAKLQIPFESENGEEGLYTNLINLFKKYDDIVRTQTDQNSSIGQLTNTAQTTLIQSIAEIILQRIEEEVAAAKFFALIADEVNCNPKCRQISIVLRYVRNGRPIERFIGIYDVGFERKSEDIAALLDRELKRFKYKSKMVAQSYDGKLVKSSEVFSLQQSVKKLLDNQNQVLFVHYYGHDFNTVLADSLRSIQECKLFFSVIFVFCKFLNTKVNLLEVLPNASTTLLDSIPKCIATIKNHYDAILKVLERVTTHEQFGNSFDTIAHAVNLINHLKSFKFLIYVTMFERFFELIENTFKPIVRNVFDSKNYRKHITSLINNLKLYKTEDAFKKLVEAVPLSGQQSTISSMYPLYIQILENIIFEIEGRFFDIELSDFFSLLSLDNLTRHTGKKGPDNSLLAGIKENYAAFFEVNKLRNELELLYSDPSILGVGQSEITCITDMLKFVYEGDIQCYIPELCKFLEMAVVFPPLVDPVEENTCAVNRIKAYCNNVNTDRCNNALALIAVEKDLVTELEQSSQWYAKIIDYFASLPTSSDIELTYKHTTIPELPSGNMKSEVIAQPDLDIKTEMEIL